MKRRNLYRNSFAGLFFRHLYVVLLLGPLALLMSALALAGSFVTISFSVLLCFLYRTLWFACPEGRLVREARKFEKHKQKIKTREQVKRARLSGRYDRQNIRELTSMVCEQLDRRKHEIMIDISVLARIQLRECIRTLDFYVAMEMYNALIQSPVETVNQRLAQLVGPNRQDWLVYE